MADNEKRTFPEIRIRGITKTRQQLINIAANKGIDFDIFIKSELLKVVDS